MTGGFITFRFLSFKNLSPCASFQCLLEYTVHSYSNFSLASNYVPGTILEVVAIINDTRDNNASSHKTYIVVQADGLERKSILVGWISCKKIKKVFLKKEEARGMRKPEF